jgi:hypothetical protein
MAESSGKREGDKSEPQAAAPANDTTDNASATSRASAGDSNLPVVWSPQLGADESMVDGSPELEAAEAASSDDESVGAAPDESAPAAASQPRSWRFAMLAATVALAAALGSFIGAMSASGIAHLTSAPVAPVATVPASSMTDAGSILRALKSQTAELAAIKAGLDGAIRTTNVQYSSISDRLDRVEHFTADPAMAAKLAHIAETVDRLDKLNAAPETTSSIATVAPTNTLPAEPKITDRILQDWIVQDVRGDRALVESRYGGVFDVSVGSVLPGLGHVQSVKRQDGQWIVVTERGTIMSAH